MLRDKTVIRALRLALKDPIPSVRIKAAESAGALGQGASSCVSELNEMSMDKNELVKVAAMAALGKINSK